jgi:hypothetical protein
MEMPEPSVQPKNTYYVNTDKQSELKKNIKKILKPYSGISVGYVFSNDYEDYIVEDAYSIGLLYGKQITRNWAWEVPFRYIKKDLINKDTQKKTTTSQWTSQLLLAYYEKWGKWGIGIKAGCDFTLDNILDEGFNGIGILEFGYGEKEGLDYGISFETNVKQENTKYLILFNFYFR